MDVTIAVCTFGDERWKDLAAERAVPSAKAQGVEVVTFHADVLHNARNEALNASDGWIIYLDADDQLEPGYVDAMLAGTGDVRAPSVQRVRRGRNKRGRYMPRVWGHRHECVGGCLPEGNWVTVGAMVSTHLLKDAGGWQDEPIYEDWSVWLRCWKAGGDVQPCPDAVYRYWFSDTTRNGSLPPKERDEWHWRIHDSIMEAPV